MKTFIPRFFVFSVGLALQCSAIAQEKVRSFTWDRTEYIFNIETGAANRWDQIQEDNPPLSVSKAIEVASSFMKRIPLEDDKDKWILREVSLKPNGRSNNEWFYVISFWLDLSRHKSYAGASPRFDVPVLMSAAIPKPDITRRK